MTTLEKLEAFPPEVISHYLDTGISEAIPDELKLFVDQISMAAEIKHHYASIAISAQKLTQRVKAVQNIRMSVRLAKERIYDAMNFFHVDAPVAQKVWDMSTADKLDSYAQVLTAQEKYDKAAKCTIDANELRKRANDAVNNEDLKAPVFLISNKISLTDMGFEKENLKSIAKKDNEGYYLHLIKNLDVDNEEKKRLLRDANIQDTDFEEIENDGPQ